ncbi:MAG: ATP-binding cassette domain-containing protein [Gemmatimonadota bacterium]
MPVQLQQGFPVNVPALEASGVSKCYGSTRALHRVGLRVFPGERVALVGESGSGKTTLLRLFNRMVLPDEGAALVEGRDVAGEDPIALRRSVGYVQQEGGLIPHWSVSRNVALVPRLRGMDDPADRARIALEGVGLDPDTFGGRWPRQLSGGQRQRVALARALAARPEVVLLDEPFGALDAITRSEVRSAFAALVRRLGVTVLLVTHDLQEALALADRVAVMREGRIESVASPDDLRSRPETPYVARLLEKADVR